MAGWDDVPDADQKPSKGASGWDAVPASDTPAKPSETWKTTPYGFSVKDAVTPDTGKPTVQSKEGFLWYGPEQGNQAPKGGWFNPKGQKVQPAADVDPALFSKDELSKGMADSVSQGVFAAGLPIGSLGSKVRAALESLKFGKAAAPLARVAVGTGIGAVAAPAFTDDSKIEDPVQKAQQKIAEAKNGAKWGAILSTGLEAVPPTLGLMGAGLRRLVVGKYGPAAQGVLDDLRAQGVEPRPSTVLNAAKVGTPSEEVAAARQSGNNLVSELEANTQNTPYRGIDRISNAARSGDQEAQGVLDRVNTPNQSTSQVAQTSGAVQAKRAQLIKNELWGGVDAQAGPGGVPLPDTYDAIQKLRAEMSTKGDIPGLGAELDRLERYFPQRDPATGRMIAPQNPDNSFGALKVDAVQRLNDILRGVAKNADEKALQRGAGILKDALETGDMQTFAQSDPKLWSVYNRANKFHSEVYAPTKESQPFNIQNLFATDQASNPAFADQLIAKLGQKSSGPDRGAAVANALGPKGRAAFAQAIVENSLSKGLVDRTGTWVPGGAASDLSGRMDTLNALLPKGPERLRVQGVLNMFQHLAKAAPENASALGERFAQVAGSGQGVLGQVVKAYNYMRDGGIDVLFNTQAGKDFLFKMSSVKPGSVMATRLISDDLPKIMGLKAAQVPPAPLRPQLSPAAGEGTDPTVAKN